MEIKRKVIEVNEFHEVGTWAAFDAAVAWAKEKGYSAGSTSATYPLALVKGEYCETPLPHKWKNFSESHLKYVDGMISGDFREGPMVVTLFEPSDSK